MEAIQNMAMPRYIKGIRMLLGKLHYYRRFVPEMAKYLAPLNNLLKKGRQLAITPVIEDNVRKCMARLQNRPVLAFPDLEKTFIITTDVTKLWAVLAQEWNKGEQPVAYASRLLWETKERYSALERELLGIVWAVGHFRPYIFGRNFKIHTEIIQLSQYNNQARRIL